MTEVSEQPIRLRVSFSLLAFFLLVVAGTRWGLGALLPIGLLLASLGLVVLLASRVPAPTRWAAFGVFAYVLLWLFTWVAQTPITIGDGGYWVNATPPRWAEGAQNLLVDGMPFAFVAGVGAGMWAWSPRRARIFLGIAGGLLLLSGSLGLMSEPPSTTDTDAVLRAELYGTLSVSTLSLACLAEVAALGLLIRTPPTAVDPDPR